LNRIDEFEFTPEQEDTLVLQVENMITAGIDKGDSLIDLKQKTLKGKLRKFAVRTLVPEEKIRALVPMFAQTIVDEIQKPENKEALKYVIKSKLQEYSDLTHADSEVAVLRLNALFNKYEVADLEAFNRKTSEDLKELEALTYSYTYILLGIILPFLLLWWLLRNKRSLHIPLFIISVLFSLVLLFAGLTAPMIEIDARFQQVNFLLIGEQITFSDQVIFFQTKSILQVIGILFETGKVDSFFVGLLILVFSIIFPVAKLISTQIYLAGNKKQRKNKLLKFFAFKSGKWSMADVYVIAIFMAYIGFQGILDHQLSNLDMETESLVSISTNKTSLQPGFIIFIGFVLFSLLLSTILKKMTGKKKKNAVISNEPV
uniref:paraquat-inducible protein A n=1 Tax=Salegentibacter sp. TaxID=1903072 RepID=UPI00356920C6